MLKRKNPKYSNYKWLFEQGRERIIILSVVRWWFAEENDRGLIWGMRSLLVRKTVEKDMLGTREWSKQRQEIIGNALDEAG